jgi:hypothetical protein
VVKKYTESVINSSSLDVLFTSWSGTRVKAKSKMMSRAGYVEYGFELGRMLGYWS